MSASWNLIQPQVVDDTTMNDLEYGDIIERDGRFDAHSLQALASGVLNDATPKVERDLSREYIPTEYDAPKSTATSHVYEHTMSTPPLSPSTTISSLPTEEGHYSSDEQYLPSQENREEIRRGKQAVAPTPEENAPDEYGATQDDSDWYGMQYALDQSRYDYTGSAGVWPPSAGESSTSDAAFVAMYDGYIYPQDVEYWYQHWCKWHRALAREEKRRRDRAASDAKRVRVYDHATYVQWERAQNKRRMAQAPGNAVGSKPMSATRHRSSTCLF